MLFNEVNQFVCVCVCIFSQGWGWEGDSQILTHVIDEIIRFSYIVIGEGNGNPLQYSCLGNPRDRAARWATVHRVTKSWTRLSRYLSFLSMLPRRVSIMGNISLLTKFKKKRSLEVHRYIPFCLFTYMFIKD